MSTPATGIGITRLGQISINVKDVERAVAFYQEKLGLRLLFKAPPGLAFFDCGGVRLMLDRGRKTRVRSSQLDSLFLCARYSGRARQIERK